MSQIFFDQALEQVNAVVKADGGAYGVTGDSAAQLAQQKKVGY